MEVERWCNQIDHQMYVCVCVCEFFSSAVAVVCAYCISESRSVKKPLLIQRKSHFFFVCSQFYFVQCIICWYFDWVFIFDVRCNGINVGATKQFVYFFLFPFFWFIFLCWLHLVYIMTSNFESIAIRYLFAVLRFNTSYFSIFLSSVYV